jgi:hypothetical protein
MDVYQYRKYKNTVSFATHIPLTALDIKQNTKGNYIRKIYFF